MTDSRKKFDVWNKGKKVVSWVKKQGSKKIGIVLIVLGLAMLLMSQIQFFSTYRSRTVNLRMEDIGELNTQAGYFTNVQVITKSRDIFGIEVPFTQNKYIYSYDGIIKAGINFTEVKISIDSINKTVNITLPHAKINSIEVDEDSLVVYDETKNIFTPLKLDDIRSSRMKMEEEARNRAVENGILKEAEDNAKVLIWALLQGEEIADYTPVWNFTEEE